jgi:lipoyl(octanoyl) transferase
MENPDLRPSLPVCAVHRLGMVAYTHAWHLQDRLAGEIARGQRPATLLLLEHPHTYTLGRRGQPENLLWDAQELERRGVSVHWVDRGGDITYHGPGQLVGYPLIPLAAGGLRSNLQGDRPRLPQADYVGYVRQLEEVLITALDLLGLPGERLEGLTGVWYRPQASKSSLPAAKVAAIGVKVDVHGITRHGFALNVHSNMSYWNGIIGCGLKDSPVTRLADLLEPHPAMETVLRAVEQAFGQVFGFQMVITNEDLLSGQEDEA